jgi:hypothetical protein
MPTRSRWSTSAGARRIPSGHDPGGLCAELGRAGRGRNLLIVANDKGIGTRYSFECDHGVCGYNTHQDNGTVSIVPVPNSATLATMTSRFSQTTTGIWTQNIESASGGSPKTKPVAIPANIGDPSLIKHVFLIVRENRTYDQILGDVAAGNGDPSLAVFGDGPQPVAFRSRRTRTCGCSASLSWTISTTRAASRLTVTSGSQEAWRPTPTTSSRRTGSAAIPAGTPAMHSPIRTRASCSRKRSRRSAGEDLRRIRRERYVLQPNGRRPSGEPSWSQFYADSQCFEGGPDCGPPGTAGETTLYYQNTVQAESSIPAVSDTWSRTSRISIWASRPVPRRSVGAGLQQ